MCNGRGNGGYIRIDNDLNGSFFFERPSSSWVIRFRAYVSVALYHHSNIQGPPRRALMVARRAATNRTYRNTHPEQQVLNVDPESSPIRVRPYLPQHHMPPSFRTQIARSTHELRQLRLIIPLHPGHRNRSRRQRRPRRRILPLPTEPEKPREPYPLRLPPPYLTPSGLVQPVVDLHHHLH